MRRILSVLTIVLTLSFLAAGPAFARRGADDPPGDDRGGRGGSGGGGSADDNGGQGGNRRGWINHKRARALLTRVADASDANAFGWVEIRSDRQRERFRIVVERLDAGAAVSASLDDGAGGFIDLGTAIANLLGEAKWEFDTRAGDALPGDVAAVGDLSGRSLTVFDSAGADLLTGTVPAFGRPGRAHFAARSRFGGEVEIEIHVRARIANVFRIVMQLGGLVPGARYTFWVEDPAGSGEMTQLRDFRSDGRGRVRTLLLLKNMAGRAFEVRNAAGETVFSGVIPTL